MKSDLNDLKKLTLELMKNGKNTQDINPSLIQKICGKPDENTLFNPEPAVTVYQPNVTPQQEEFHDDDTDQNYLFAETVEEEEILRLEQKEFELIKKALERNKGKRKAAADELGISERTLYRKIKQFDL
jgi:DNA-binding NtrC family response regulator